MLLPFLLAQETPQCSLEHAYRTSFSKGGGHWAPPLPSVLPAKEAVLFEGKLCDNLVIFLSFMKAFTHPCLSPSKTVPGCCG